MVVAGTLFWFAVAGWLAAVGYRLLRARFGSWIRAGAYLESVKVSGIRVTNGHTLDVRLEGEALPAVLRRLPLRLARIEAPELFTKEKPGDRAQPNPAGAAVVEALHDILKVAKRIRIRKLQQCDSFMLAGEVFADGVNVSDTLLRHGLVKRVE